MIGHAFAGLRWEERVESRFQKERSRQLHEAAMKMKKKPPSTFLLHVHPRLFRLQTKPSILRKRTQTDSEREREREGGGGGAVVRGDLDLSFLHVFSWEINIGCGGGVTLSHLMPANTLVRRKWGVKLPSFYKRLQVTLHESLPSDKCE